MTPTLGTLWDQRKFYSQMNRREFNWMTTAYQFNTGFDPLEIYYDTCKTVRDRILMNVLFTIVTIGFWYLFYKESLQSDWLLPLRDYPVFHIACIVNLIVMWVMESRALDALIVLKWRTYSFCDEVHTIIPEGEPYGSDKCLKALVGTEIEIFRECIPDSLMKSHPARLVRIAHEIINQEVAPGSKIEAQYAVRRESMKRRLNVLHATGKKFGLFLLDRKEKIDTIYSVANVAKK